MPLPGKTESFNPLEQQQARNAAVRAGGDPSAATMTPQEGTPGLTLADGINGSVSSDPSELFAAASTPTAVAEDRTEDLHLSKLTAAARDDLKASDFVFPDARRYPIHDLSHARNALARASGKSEEAKVKAAVYNRYPELRPSKKNMSMDDALTIYQELDLAVETDHDDGLIWKCVCEEGTLALSPGPGQVDVEKPLNLTADLMEDLKTSVDEGAFPYVTIPETHNNSLLENTGYVRKAEVRISPAGKKQLWCGLDFTEPDVKGRVERGSIADTSVGVKFNFRNKRTGKTFPAALEHVNLTNQPWVDGMPAFGERAMLSQEPFDQEDEDFDWRGVYVELPEVELSQETTSETEEQSEVEVDPTLFETEEDTSDAGDILPDVTPDDSLLSMPQEKRTVEQVLAEQKAENERLAQKLEQQGKDLQLAQGTISSQGQQLHASQVDADIKRFVGKIDPAVLIRAREIKLASYGADSEGSLKLSIVEGEGDEAKTVEKEFGPSEVVDYLLAAMPQREDAPVSEELSLALDEHSSKEQKPDALDPVAEADEIEREMHPERFDGDKRKETV